jgi:putative ABC transport system substrate-binding protein
VVSSAVSLLTEPDQIVALTAQHSLPAVYAWRPSVAVGGLMSYATSLPNAWRQADSQRRKTGRSAGLAADQV